MGFYEDRVLPRIINAACGIKSAEPLRAGSARVSRETGRNRLRLGAQRALLPGGRYERRRGRARGPRLAASREARQSDACPGAAPGLDGQALPFADHRFDAALSTWTLCTIPNVAAALREVRRVLKPGGTFHFLEHGLAPDERVRVWQRRLDPIEKRLFGGCHFTRPIVDLVTTAGFSIKEVDLFYEQGAPKFAGASSLGTAVAP